MYFVVVDQLAEDDRFERDECLKEDIDLVGENLRACDDLVAEM